jgi:hypothetical protein
LNRPVHLVSNLPLSNLISRKPPPAHRRSCVGGIERMLFDVDLTAYYYHVQFPFTIAKTMLPSLPPVLHKKDDSYPAPAAFDP